MEVDGIGFLPRDVIVDVLSRLPVKTLCKFMCVSKQWRRLISTDACFIGRHRLRSKANPLLIFRKYSSLAARQDTQNRVTVDLTSIDMDGALVGKFGVPTDGPVYSFVSSGHLILLRCMFRVFVCNPGTQEFAPLPRSSSTTYCTVGFGWLSESNVYKVVHLFFKDPLGRGEKMESEVFTLTDGGRVGSGCWRRIRDCPYRVFTDRSPVCVYGEIYWMVSEKVNGSMENRVVMFDVEREEFGAISYPEWPSQPDFNSVFLSGLKGCLCLVEMKTWAMEIWVLRDRRSSIWVKEHSIGPSNLDWNCGTQAVVPWDDQNGELVISSDQRGLFCCDVEGKSFRSIENSHVVERYKKPCLYYGSFFSLSN